MPHRDLFIKRERWDGVSERSWQDPFVRKLIKIPIVTKNPAKLSFYVRICTYNSKMSVIKRAIIAGDGSVFFSTESGMIKS
ncbi:hypothetical protein A6X21_08975 [Planctopirus hydrillae]|uniref:Uncharacterized protein n=1 Tax=Planctopirus hydrillae TaxID=1841610 RepID=A0A1C3E852_9PLAN|nr:hypothetical protein A6X21_08975 [Planctopirus hydrillae]